MSYDEPTLVSVDADGTVTLSLPVGTLNTVAAAFYGSASDWFGQSAQHFAGHNDERGERCRRIGDRDNERGHVWSRLANAADVAAACQSPR